MIDAEYEDKVREQILAMGEHQPEEITSEMILGWVTHARDQAKANGDPEFAALDQRVRGWYDQRRQARHSLLEELGAATVSA